MHVHRSGEGLIPVLQPPIPSRPELSAPDGFIFPRFQKHKGLVDCRTLTKHVMKTGNIRAGLEGQLWAGFDNSHSEMSLTNNNEIDGLVLGARFRF